MKFHEWPITGTGSKSYTTRTKKFSQSFDFGNTTFDWSNMSDVYTTTTYTTVHDTAVATLMHACGVSVNMDYNTDANGGSGAYSTDLPHAYTTYFGYDKSILFVNRCMYTLREWEDLIYNNLVTYGPVQYSGSSPAGGHSFVCDGIMMNCMFHINWGWGGLSDGYFLLSALDPDSQGIGGSSGGFSEGQGAVINIHRDNGGTSPKGIENQGIYVVTDESSTGFTLNGWFTPISDAGFSGTLYVMAERVTTGSSSGSSIVIPLAPTELCSYNISSLGYGYACPSFNVTGLSSLQNGQYKIRMYYKNSNETQKHVVKTNTQRADYVLYNKATFKSTFTVPLRYNTRVTKITASPAYYCGHNIDVDVTITSDVDGVGVITLYPYFYSLEEGTFNATPVGTVGMTGLTGDLYNGENDFHYSGTLPSASKLAPGTYYLAFAVNAGQKYERQKSGGYMSVDDIVEIGGAAMFELVADPGKPVLDAITNRTHKLVIENSTNVDKTHIGLQYTVKVISGYLNDNLMLAIVPNNSNNIIAQITLPKVECWADQTTTGRCITHWDEGEIGQTYQAALFGPSNGQMTQLTYPQRFTIGQTTTSLNDLDVQGGVKVTPNPVHDVATVTSKQPIEEVEAYSIEGIAIPINADINGTRTTLDMASFSPGVYVLRLRLEDGSVTTTRLVKK